MIELLTADTPNGKKISIMLEEIGYEYKVTKVNIYKDEQFKPEFRNISPFSKIPVIITTIITKKQFLSLALSSCTWVKRVIDFMIKMKD